MYKSEISAETQRTVNDWFGLEKVLFIDEKIFIIEPHQNHQKHRRKGKKKAAAAKIVTNNYFSASMVDSADICTSEKTALVFLERNVSFNATNYQKRVICNVMVPRVTIYFGAERFSL